MTVSRRWLLKGVSLGSLAGSLPWFVPTISARQAPSPYQQLGSVP